MTAVRIEVEAHDPPAGRVTGPLGEVRFEGWIGLLRVLEQWLARPPSVPCGEGVGSPAAEVLDVPVDAEGRADDGASVEPGRA